MVFEKRGFKTIAVWTVDSFLGTAGFRWYTFVNDNHSDGDIVPWSDVDHSF